ncbi:MAG: single-stranded-DNA-specific exonuclease RecJ [Sediminibacterium sp.]|nr:single-stranded-DNA-specific exonuclease RecJ [Sediminibacterium sp.]
MQKKWKILSSSQEAINQLQASLKINATLCNILVQRGIDTYEKAHAFFRPQLSHLHSPWLMKDMDKAVTRILQAFDQQEKILVFGDYDVDGTTAVASMFQFVSAIYPNVQFYIPHRYREGYGISKLGIDFAKQENISLIISLDCGIKSTALIGYAKELDIDFIVCDHHLPDAILPPAVAILNPKQNDCNYPYKDLCGCGVGFKLMMALADKLGLPDSSYLSFLDLAAVAIAADIVPVTGENRVMAFYGIEKVNTNPSIGIKALLEKAAAKNHITLTGLVFIVAPRINAAGRMDDARKAVELFIEKDETTALAIAAQLQSDNTDRKEADSLITEEALAQLNNDPATPTKRTNVVYQENWHKGVVGIVASRLIETYYKPTIVLTKSGDYAAGSARSVAGFNLYEAIHACREHLLGYGGHYAAAGMTLQVDKIQDFAEAFEAEVARTIQPHSLVPELLIDAPISFSEINPTFYSILAQMEPFGPENMRPVFVATRVSDTGFSKIVKDLHIRFVVRQHNITFSGIGFNLAEKFSILQSGKPFDMVFTIDENEWQGQKSLQLKVIDLMG